MTLFLRTSLANASFVAFCLYAWLCAFGLSASGAGRPPVLLAGHQDAVYDVAFSPDGCLLASGSYDKTTKLWNVADQRLIATVSGHTDQVFRVEFSRDGKTLASCGGDGKVILCDVATHKIETVLTDHGDPMIDVAFSTDGKKSLRLVPTFSFGMLGNRFGQHRSHGCISRSTYRLIINRLRAAPRN